MLQLLSTIPVPPDLLCFYSFASAFVIYHPKEYVALDCMYLHDLAQGTE